MTENDMNILKSATPYFLVVRFCACSKKVSILVTVKDLENMA